ncbi:MAG: pyridoxal phosphate-dependent aminotransferase [Candidatus Cloacimonetes bacterium]|nr:pyridoxal phosphate-dependent aminotransferase [Candidatus Cloacimonadota bacterium]
MKPIEYADRITSIEKSELRQLFDKAPADAINLGLGEIQFPTPKIITERAIDIIKQGNIRYTPNAGLPELQKSITDYYNIQLNENVCVTTGAEEAIFASLFSFINPGDEVLIANPTYIAYKTIIKMLGGVTVEFDLDPLSNFKLDRNHFTNKINSKTKVLLLNNPSNPTGTCFSKSEIDFIVSKCNENNILIIVDEIYRELYIDNKPITFLNKTGKIIVISGLSKSHCMSGWRVGWVVSNDPELIKPIIISHQYICTCAPYISQEVAIKALSSEGMKDQNKIRLELKTNREFVLKQFEQYLSHISILNNTSSPYLFINVKVDDMVLVNELIENGLIVMPGRIFGSNGKHWIRLNYAVDKKKLAKGIRIIKKYYKVI